MNKLLSLLALIIISCPALYSMDGYYGAPSPESSASRHQQAYYRRALLASQRNRRESREYDSADEEFVDESDDRWTRLHFQRTPVGTIAAYVPSSTVPDIMRQAWRTYIQSQAGSSATSRASTTTMEDWKFGVVEDKTTYVSAEDPTFDTSTEDSSGYRADEGESFDTDEEFE